MQNENGDLPNTRRLKLEGIQDEINRILSQSIGYFITVTVDE